MLLIMSITALIIFNAQGKKHKLKVELHELEVAKQKEISTLPEVAIVGNADALVPLQQQLPKDIAPKETLPQEQSPTVLLPKLGWQAWFLWGYYFGVITFALRFLTQLISIFLSIRSSTDIIEDTT